MAGKSIWQSKPTSNTNIDPKWCPNQAPIHNQPSRKQQKEAEKIAREILGEALFQAPTVKMILEMQGSRMEPEEWWAIKDALLRDEGARTDIRKLCCGLPQPKN